MANPLWRDRKYRLSAKDRKALCIEIEKLLRAWRRKDNNLHFATKRLVALVAREFTFLQWSATNKIQDPKARRAEIEYVQRSVTQALDALNKLSRDSQSDIRIAGNLGKARDRWIAKNAVARSRSEFGELTEQEQIETAVTATRPPSTLVQFRETAVNLDALCDVALRAMKPPSGPEPNPARDEFARGVALAFNGYLTARNYALLTRITRKQLEEVFCILLNVHSIGRLIQPISAATLARTTYDSLHPKTSKGLRR